MRDLFSHLHKAIRQLRRNPGFALTAILTLAVGIGATTAIFSIFYAVLLRPLPYVDAGRLVDITPLDARPGGMTANEEASYPNFRDWRDQAHSFEGMASYHANAMVLNAIGSGAARNLQSGVVASDFFNVLRIVPMLGRNFLRNEEKAGSRVVVLSYGLWVSDFHSSPDVVGRSVELADELYTIVGVLPKDASFPFVAATPIDLWLTSADDAVGKNPSTEQRGWNQIHVVARLKSGVTLAQAQAEMTTIVQRLARQYPDDDVNETGVSVTPALDHMVGDVRPALRILLIAVCALLLIACANVAGLLLARGSSRQAELALRAALGARRREIMLQLLIESVVLSLAGGLAGIAVAYLTLKGMLQFVPKNLPRLDHVAISAPVLIFAILVSALTGIVFGMLPARRLSRLDPALALRDGARSTTAGVSQHWLHSALVIGETSIGLILLVGAGLLIHSFMRLTSTDPGFNPEHVLTFRAAISDKSYPDEKRLQFYDQLLSRLRALPGAVSATAAYPLPFSGSGLSLSFTIQEHPTKPADQPDALASVVEPGYVETLQIPLKAGRTFTTEDNQAKGAPVMLINQALADKYFPHEDPIGKNIQTAFDDDESGKPIRWRQIIGVVGNVHRYTVSDAAQPEQYVPYAQGEIGTPYVALRVRGDATAYANAVTKAVSEIDSEVPVYRIRTLDEGLSVASAQPRFQTLLLTAFAVVALLLASIGLYAVLSYMVSQRTQELGLRMALGAQRGNVLGLVMRRGLYLTLVGLVIGSASSLMLTRYVAKFLYGVQPLDPATYVSVAAILVLVSIVASLIPAARAASLDPMKTLRNQ
jgi:predicted permease